MNQFSWEQLWSYCYAPYSGRKEACLVKGATGLLYPGVRMENVSFPLSVDAVQSAVFSCLSEGDLPKNLLLPETDSLSVHNEYKEKEDIMDRPSTGSSESMEAITFWCKKFGLDSQIVNDVNDFDPSPFFQTGEKDTGINRLEELTQRCIIPYSSFPVTALLVSDAGIFSGVNIEISDWQKGLCAERVAVAKARAAGAKKLFEIHIYAPKSEYVSPCGACRQVLLEQMNEGTMLLHHSFSERSRLSIADLLPYQFKALSLSRPKH